MTEHLPECFASLCECDDTHFKSTDCDFSCICPSLRACEQRVLAEREAEGPWFRSVVHDCCVDKQTAYAAGLDAAREAVEREWTVDPSWDGTNWNNALTVAIDAIDALREKP